MKRMIALLSAALLVALAGCNTGSMPPVSSSVPQSSAPMVSSIPAPVSSAPASTPEKPTDDRPAILMQNNWEESPYLEEGFAKAPEYAHIGIGYYPDFNGTTRDAYLPYGGTIQRTENFIMGINHGVAVALTMAPETESASGALTAFADQFEQDLQEAGVYTTIKRGEMVTADNDTVGVVPFFAKVDSASLKLSVYVMLYADVKGEHYMLGRLEFVPEHFDADSEALVAEIQDCYALVLPTFEEQSWAN